MIAANDGAIDLYERERFRPFWQTMVAPLR